jgi:hypothetical protein
MKRRLLGLVVLSLFGSTTAFAQAGGAPSPAKPDDKQPVAGIKPAEPAMPPGMDAKTMAAMEAYGKPGAEHAKLKALEGTWDAKITFWADPKAPPQEMTGKSEMKMVMDRYLSQQFSGDMGGMPFAGQGLVGYNNVLKKYQSTWIDNMSTGVIFGEGAPDKDGNLSFTLTSTDPLKGKNVKMKDVWKFEGDKKMVTEMWGPPPKGGKDYKMMVIEYTKK